MRSSLRKKSSEYNILLDHVGVLLNEARKEVYYQVNQTLVKTYWGVGREIIEFEQKGEEKAEYGSKLLSFLSTDLTSRYGKGFSVDNLEKMRKFYSLNQNSATLSRKLSWSHYCLILRLEEKRARDFYTIESEKERWSVRELERQINSMLFERIALSKEKKKVIELSKKGQVVEKPQDLVKDPYILEFLGLEELPHYSETDLEERLIANLKHFLLELGKGFAFVARQQRITLEDEHFYIDLVFYNRLLKCFVLLELKVGKLTHKDLGQLQMYVNYYNKNIKQTDEQPTIGILLCADKKEAIVRYTLPEHNKQIFASKYKLCLPNKAELEEKVKKILNTLR
ncbi:TPA: DUF1016 domain-containing protein [Candidatus Woesearchaeota archaeon]|nr:DUF1016 family protein [Candidatus Woesearchaeota archaeon]HIG93223.1 DUF1016 domain-containing protein [Candidatus Woesearchaeota archaeon]HIH12900.1 DUF1016 domain-containing protein [Candidatus Woesearchaeota archaeon]